MSLFQFPVPPVERPTYATLAKAVAFTATDDKNLKAAHQLTNNGMGVLLTAAVPKDPKSLPPDLRRVRHATMSLTNSLNMAGCKKIRTIEVEIRKYRGVFFFDSRFHARVYVLFHDCANRVEVAGVEAGTVSHLLLKALNCEVAIRARNATLVGNSEGRALLTTM